MSDTVQVMHPGATQTPPHVDRYNPPRGELTWIDDDVVSVTTAGPALTITLDFRAPMARGREQIAVVRLRDVKGYFPTAEPSYGDPDENLCVSAIVSVPITGVAENVKLVVPYIVMPRDMGGITEVEVTVYDPAGGVNVLDYHQVELPEDLDRTPDLLTVVVHALAAVSSLRAPLGRDAVRAIRTLIVERFELDELGDQALRRILKVAARAEHSPQTLAEAVRHAMPEPRRDVLVDLLYDVLETQALLREVEQRFVTELLDATGVHDHRRYGPKHLLPFYEALELDAGADLDAVKAAYRKMVRDYHPDRVQHLAKGFVQFAHDKTKALNDAYGRLREALERKGEDP